MPKKIIGALSLALAAAIWGSMYVVSKIVLEEIPPFTLVTLRFFLAFLIFAFFYYMNYEKVKRSDYFMFAWLGFIGFTISIGAQFLGTKWANAHLGALITSSSPVFISLFALPVLKEKISLKDIIALLFATIGVIIILGWTPIGKEMFWGIISLIIAALSWAYYTVLGKKLAKGYSSLTIMFYATLFGIVFTLPITAVELVTSNWVVPTALIIWLGVLYLGIVSTAIAFYLWNYGFRFLSSTQGSLFFFFQPVVGTFLSSLILHEELTFSFIVGFLFVLLGVIVTTIKIENYYNE